MRYESWHKNHEFQHNMLHSGAETLSNSSNIISQPNIILLGINESTCLLNCKRLATVKECKPQLDAAISYEKGQFHAYYAAPEIMDIACTSNVESSIAAVLSKFSNLPELFVVYLPGQASERYRQLVEESLWAFDSLYGNCVALSFLPSGWVNTEGNEREEYEELLSFFHEHGVAIHTAHPVTSRSHSAYIADLVQVAVDDYAILQQERQLKSQTGRRWLFTKSPEVGPQYHEEFEALKAELASLHVEHRETLAILEQLSRRLSSDTPTTNGQVHMSGQDMEGNGQTGKEYTSAEQVYALVASLPSKEVLHVLSWLNREADSILRSNGYLTVTEASKRKKLSPSRIKELAERRVFPGAENLGIWYIPASELDAFKPTGRGRPMNYPS